jgi:hypothetical protein
MFNDDEKAAIRYYLGYPGISQSRMLSLGIPDASQLQFILELNFDNVLPSHEPYIRRALQELGCIEDQQSKLRGSLGVTHVVGSVKLDTVGALEALDDQFVNWTCKLSDLLGAPPNVFSNTNNRLRMAGGISDSGVIEPG